MSDVVIKAENIGKKYVIGHQAERSDYKLLRRCGCIRPHPLKEDQKPGNGKACHKERYNLSMDNHEKKDIYNRS